MNKNIYRHEFRSRIRSVISWSLAVISMIMVFFSLFPAFSGEAAMVNQMMENFPPEFRSAFGLNTLDLSSALGFFGFILIFVQLCLAIQAGNYGFGLVSIEESELTADFLLSKPVSRDQVMNSKLLAVLTSLIITNLVVWVSGFTAMQLFHGEHEYDAGRLALLLSGVLIFQLFFLSVGLIVSLVVRRIRNVTPYGLGLGFGMYVLSAFSGLFADVKLEYLTPFKHLDPAYIIQHGTFDTPLVLLNLAVSLVSLVASYWLYIHRDIPAVS